MLAFAFLLVVVLTSCHDVTITLLQVLKLADSVFLARKISFRVYWKITCRCSSRRIEMRQRRHPIKVWKFLLLCHLLHERQTSRRLELLKMFWLLITVSVRYCSLKIQILHMEYNDLTASSWDNDLKQFVKYTDTNTVSYSYLQIGCCKSNNKCFILQSE